MTDRVKALTVVLDSDIRTDDVEMLVDAISMLRCVIKVEKRIVTSDDYLARQRARFELRERLRKLLEDEDE